MIEETRGKRSKIIKEKTLRGFIGQPPEGFEDMVGSEVVKILHGVESVQNLAEIIPHTKQVGVRVQERYGSTSYCSGQFARSYLSSSLFIVSMVFKQHLGPEIRL